MELTCTTPNSIDSVADQLLDHLDDAYRVILFEGDLGAGKTTLIQAICRRLGTRDSVTSPTFVLINEYQAEVQTIYHIDLYRLKSVREAIDIGIEDILYSGNWCFIEWPGLIMPMVDSPYALVQIEIEGATSRKFRILKYTSAGNS